MPTAWARTGVLLCGLLIAVTAVNALQARSEAIAPGTAPTPQESDWTPHDRFACGWPGGRSTNPHSAAAAGELPSVFPAASASWHTVRALHLHRAIRAAAMH